MADDPSTEPAQGAPRQQEPASQEDPAAAEPAQEAPEPAPEPWEQENYGDYPEEETYPEEQYPEETYEQGYEEQYESVTPEAYGWRPLPEEPAVFPLAGAIVAIVGLAALAYARLDTVIATLDFDPFTRAAGRALAQELGTLLLGGTLLVSGVLAERLRGGAKAALAIVGALILLGGPFIAL